MLASSFYQNLVNKTKMKGATEYFVKCKTTLPRIKKFIFTSSKYSRKNKVVVNHLFDSF